MIDTSDILSVAKDASGAVGSIAETLKKLRDLFGPQRPAPEQGMVREQLLHASEAMVTANEKLFLLQQNMTALADENRALKAEVEQLRRFDAEVERYELRALALHSHAYVERGAAGPQSQTAYYCPACMAQRRKSVLQFHLRDFRRDQLKCHSCGTIVHVDNDFEPTVHIAKSHGDWDL